MTIEPFLYSLIYSHGFVAPILLSTRSHKICLRGDHALVAEAVLILLIAQVQKNPAREDSSIYIYVIISLVI